MYSKKTGNSEKESTDSVDVTKRTEIALKVVSASAILTAVMGWPAVSLHFSRYGIPSEFETTHSAIRAGILPALILILVFGYLWYVQQVITKAVQYSNGPYVFRIPIFLFQAFIPAVGCSLAIYGGLFCAFFYIAVSTTIRLGLSVKLFNIWFSILVIASFALTAGMIILFKKIQIIIYTRLSEAEQFDTKYLIIRLYYSNYFTLIRVFLGLYFIYKVFFVLIPIFTIQISLLGLLFVAAFLSMAPGLVHIGIALTKREQDLSLHSLQASKGFAIVAILIAVMYYSVDIYPWSNSPG